MGIAFLKSFVASENGNLSHIIKHLEHVIDLVGVEHVGIGPDFIDHATPENQSLLGDRNPMGAKESVKDMEILQRSQTSQLR